LASPSQTPSWNRNTPCPCKGCTVARQNEREQIIYNLEQYKDLNDVGIQTINYAYEQVIKMLKENKL
jgi:hypothetical protein